MDAGAGSPDPLLIALARAGLECPVLLDTDADRWQGYQRLATARRWDLVHDAVSVEPDPGVASAVVTDAFERVPPDERADWLAIVDDAFHRGRVAELEVLDAAAAGLPVDEDGRAAFGPWRSAGPPFHERRDLTTAERGGSSRRA